MNFSFFSSAAPNEVPLSFVNHIEGSLRKEGILHIVIRDGIEARVCHGGSSC